MVKEEKKEAIVTFRDAAGREWHPKVTARVIRDFEKVAGIGLFEAIFDTFIEEGLGEAEPTDNQIFKISKKLFGHIGNLTYLLYQSCCNSSGNAYASAVDEFMKEVSYDDFCQAITKNEIDEAIAAAIAALFGFFPNLAAMSNAQGEDGDGPATSPPEAGPGKTSMNSPGSGE